MMEKLQAALEKARKNRVEGPIADPYRNTTPGAPVEADIAWSSLSPLEVEAARSSNRRIIAFDGGPEAMPFDMVRTKVLQLLKKNNWRRIAITSPTPGCGKTTVAANLAVSFGRQLDMKTMLFDLDMRRPELGKTMGYTGRYGVGDILEERVSFQDQAKRLGANVALSMNAHPLKNPAELLLRQRTSEIFDEIEAVYQPNVTLFDMPPMLTNDDTAAFLRNVDCAIIIAEAEASTIKQIDFCERELSNQTNVLGVVLNKCRFADENYGYDYYGY
jgi:protein-tyrosine kinase